MKKYQKFIGELIHTKFEENVWVLSCLLLFCFEIQTDKSVLIPLKNAYELKNQNHNLHEKWWYFNENLTVQAIISQKNRSVSPFATKF